MVHGRGSGFVLAAVIGLMALAPAQAAAAGEKNATTRAPARQTLPVAPAAADTPARPATARGGVAISVGPDGMPWIENSSGQIYERI